MNLSGNNSKVARRRSAGWKSGAIVAAVFAAGASPAAAQYGSGPPLQPLPPLPAVQGPAGPQGAAGAQGPAGPQGPQGPEGVADAVDRGVSRPAEGTADVADDNTGVGAQQVRVVSSEAVQAVPASTGSLPFTGARVGILAAFGAALLAAGLGLRRRFAALPEH